MPILRSNRPWIATFEMLFVHSVGQHVGQNVVFFCCLGYRWDNLVLPCCFSFVTPSRVLKMIPTICRERSEAERGRSKLKSQNCPQTWPEILPDRLRNRDDFKAGFGRLSYLTALPVQMLRQVSVEALLDRHFPLFSLLKGFQNGSPR